MRQHKTKKQKHFNSHAHVERDVATNMVYYRYSNFNSHAHVERDPDTNKFTASTKISTHTLTWSVTTKNKFTMLMNTFQLTRSRGA